MLKGIVCVNTTASHPAPARGENQFPIIQCKYFYIRRNLLAYFSYHPKYIYIL